MKRRKWTPEQKAKIVMEGLKGRPISEICNEYQITQSLYYQWRDLFLSNMGKAFEVKKQGQREATLQRENAKLKQLVGELTVELKKSDDWLE